MCAAPPTYDTHKGVGKFRKLLSRCNVLQCVCVWGSFESFSISMLMSWKQDWDKKLSKYCLLSDRSLSLVLSNNNHYWPFFNWHLFVYFLSFEKAVQFYAQINVTKIRCWDWNSWPLIHESSHITTNSKQCDWMLQVTWQFYPIRSLHFCFA